jgi:hypothetical protein
MIILREKTYAEQDYAGIKTALGTKWIKFNRNLKARQLTLGRRNNQKELNKELGKLNDSGLTGKEKATVQQNMIQKYNENNDKTRNKAITLGKTTTKTNPTQTYIKNNPSAPISHPSTPTISVTQPKQGMSLGGKVALGAGIAAAGYGAYRLLKNRRQKKQEEEKI